MEVELTRSQKQEVLVALSARVDRTLTSIGMATNEWESNLRASEPDILDTPSRHDFEGSINRLLRTLNLSHVGFEHEALDRCSAGRALSVTCTAVEIDKAPRWMFQDVHEGGPAYKAGVRSGDVLLTIDDVPISPPTQPSFQIPSTARITTWTHQDREESKSITIPAPRRRWFLPGSKTPPAFVEPSDVVYRKKMAQEMGYIKVSMFPGSIGIDVANEMEEAVKELGNITRLIIDLRGNGGGGVGFMRLLNLLSSRPLIVGTFRSRSAVQTEASANLDTFVLPGIPRHKIQIFPLAMRFFWRNALSKVHRKALCIRLEAQGGGTRSFHGRVVILANRHTASASEMLIACAKETHLATIVGEPTAGRVRGGSKTKLPHGFCLMLPVGSYLTAQGVTLEGAPISPDISVAFDSEKARVGKDAQLERAIEIVSAL